jgi:hypothetical protein
MSAPTAFNRAPGRELASQMTRVIATCQTTTRPLSFSP